MHGERSFLLFFGCETRMKLISLAYYLIDAQRSHSKSFPPLPQSKVFIFASQFPSICPYVELLPLKVNFQFLTASTFAPPRRDRKEIKMQRSSQNDMTKTYFCFGKKQKHISPQPWVEKEEYANREPLVRHLFYFNFALFSETNFQIVTVGVAFTTIDQREQLFLHQWWQHQINGMLATSRFQYMHQGV